MKPENSINLRENLNYLLKGDRRSLASIAKELGINKSTLHNWQNGVTPQSLISLLRLAEYFEIPMADLIFSKDRNQGRNQVIYQISVEEKYEVIIRKIERRSGKNDD